MLEIFFYSMIGNIIGSILAQVAWNKFILRTLNERREKRERRKDSVQAAPLHHNRMDD